MATVEKLTGVHIDHFAEVNLDGFYQLAKVLGGVEVCLKQRGSRQELRGELPGRATSTWTPRKRWRSSASATACPMVTWTGPTASRRSSTR